MQRQDRLAFHSAGRFVNFFLALVPITSQTGTQAIASLFVAAARSAEHQLGKMAVPRADLEIGAPSPLSPVQFCRLAELTSPGYSVPMAKRLFLLDGMALV